VPTSMGAAAAPGYGYGQPAATGVTMWILYRR
jgi:hypothetical protein